MECDPTAVIPHRPPILCVDRILQADGQLAVTERWVREGADVSGGVLWEEGLLEGFTQTAAVLLSHHVEEKGHRLLKGMLVGIRGLEIRRPVRLNERICYRVELLKKILPLSVVRCEASCGDEVIACGEMKFFVESGE